MPDTPSNFVGPLALWRDHWREIKLQALDYRFYQHQVWQPAEGDLYCITRHSPKLCRVKSFGPTSIVMETLLKDDCTEPEDERERFHTWDSQDFLAGGFACCRIHIPVFIWRAADQKFGGRSYLDA